MTREKTSDGRLARRTCRTTPATPSESRRVSDTPSAENDPTTNPTASPLEESLRAALGAALGTVLGEGDHLGKRPKRIRNGSQDLRDRGEIPAGTNTAAVVSSLRKAISEDAQVWRGSIIVRTIR